MLSQYQGHCCPAHLISEQIQNQSLYCVICYQVMAQPVILNCGSGHTFGMSCISLWVNKKQNPTCPYCRKPSKTWKIDKELQQEANKLHTKCPYCENWEGKIKSAQNHYNECQKYEEYLENKLNEIVFNMKKILDIDINPHLKQKHSQIFEKYVQDWKWLKWDTRNWKWWWWAHNPWWNQPCVPCNNYWHKHQKKIDQLQNKRIQIIQILNKRKGLQLDEFFMEK